MTESTTGSGTARRRSAPMRIGILGAARIAEEAIVAPARETGSELTVVGARSLARARAFADEHGVRRATDDYARVIDDPEVDLIYNPLPNAMHAEWNLRAIAAGKHVLSEKPFARNAAEAREVDDAARSAGLVVADGFHYRYHPSFLRLIEIVEHGEIGEVVAVRARFLAPRPPAGDLRISPELAGGALMDAGCYSLHAVHLVSALLLGPARLESAEGRAFADLPDIDEAVTAEFSLPRGARGVAHCWMGADRIELTLEVEGTAGSVRIPNFVRAQLDDRVMVSDQRGRVIRTEHTGVRTSYTYQLEAVLRAVRYGAPLPTDSSDAVTTMDLVDECYRLIGMRPRA
jgi:predicted dehydrogenase